MIEILVTIGITCLMFLLIGIVGSICPESWSHYHYWKETSMGRICEGCGEIQRYYSCDEDGTYYEVFKPGKYELSPKRKE